MIELTEQQLLELAKPGAVPPRVVNPQTQETFVLLPVVEYQRLTAEEKAEEYDDSPWTREELHALAWEAGKQTWEAGKQIGWEDMNAYDEEPEKP